MGQAVQTGSAGKCSNNSSPDPPTTRSQTRLARPLPSGVEGRDQQVTQHGSKSRIRRPTGLAEGSAVSRPTPGRAEVIHCWGAASEALFPKDARIKPICGFLGTRLLVINFALSREQGIRPCVEFVAIRGQALTADSDNGKVWSHFDIERCATHAQVGRSFSNSDYPRQDCVLHG